MRNNFIASVSKASAKTFRDKVKALEIHKRTGCKINMIAELLTWFVKADKKLGTAGTQIDLIIDRRDRVINLCEMKFSLSEYAIDKDYDEKLRKRIEIFRKNSKTKKAVQIVFVTTYGVESNQYSGIVQKQVTLDDLFKAKEI